MASTGSVTGHAVHGPKVQTRYHLLTLHSSGLNLLYHRFGEAPNVSGCSLQKLLNLCCGSLFEILLWLQNPGLWVSETMG